MKRTANAIWQGSGKDGKGVLTTQSKTLENTQYSYKSRFEEGVGTNPEELVAAAHAGCFAMALSFQLQNMGITPESLDVSAVVTLDPPTSSITSSALTLKAKIPGITDEQFKQATENAKKGCPISKLLNTNITLESSLV
jgi:osmotically inducible protein OsmC